ncbi:MAG: gluconokinase [Steroidobacter sp.]
MTAFVLMGVSGAGKTTVGKRAASELGLTFIEGDDFHPRRNVEKMSSGVPLTDEDRAPWIDALAAGVNDRSPRRDVIIACSALSRSVRNRLRNAIGEPLHFVLLTADRAVIQKRLDARPRHYMKPGMLDSQLAALEAPSDAITIDVDRPLPEVCRELVARVRERSDSG